MKIKILLVIGVVWAMTSNANAACSIHTWVTDGDNPIYHHTLHCTGYSGAEDADQACVEWVNNFDSSNGSAEYCGTVIIPGEIAWKERGWFRNFDEPRHWFFGKFYYSVCPNNSTFVEGVGCIPFDDQGNQCTAENKGGTSIGNPVNVATGNKFHEETIDVGSDLSIGFAYNSNYPIYRNGSKSINTVAIGWTHEFANTISEVISVNGQNTVFMRRPDGRTIQFNEINGVWTPPIYFKGELTRETSGDWVYQSPDNVIERYASPSIPLLTNNFSRLTSVQDEDGKLLNITYSGPGLEIDRISDNFGSYIEFEYQQFTLYQRAETRITSIRDDENRVWGFTYDSNHNLTDINYPDTTSKTFHYEDSNHPHALTGITDRRGVRFATYEYDTERRVNREWHHAKDLNGIDINVEELSIVYNQDNTRTITNSRGEVSTYEVEQTNGLWQIKSIIGPGCSSCSNDNTDFIYDANNNLISKTRDGVTTEYGGYDSKGQYGYKIEAAGTVDAKRTDYTYDTRFIGKITSVTEDSVYAGNDKVTSYVYNALGQMTSMTVSGYEKDGTAINKTTTYEYNGPFNQISLSDGPIPGTADQTVYQYYPETNPVPERRNRLKRVTGPEGIIDRNHIRWSSTGKVTEEQRPNGITIYNSYDPDTDRLVSVTQTDGAKSVVTQFTYLATGHVESVTSNHGTAEASTLTLTYDDALRVTRVTDELGNYIEYELDTAGNQTGEYTRDPNGVLKKQINQVFDAYDMIDTMTQSGVTVNYDYGSNGVLNQQTNGENIISDYSYDNLKRLTQITQDFQGSGTTANTTTNNTTNNCS